MKMFDGFEDAEMFGIPLVLIAAVFVLCLIVLEITLPTTAGKPGGKWGLRTRRDLHRMVLIMGVSLAALYALSRLA